MAYDVYAEQKRRLAQRREMAEAMAERAGTQRTGRMVGDVYVAPHWGEGLMQLAEGWMAGRARKNIDREEKDLEKGRQSSMAAAVEAYRGAQDEPSKQAALDALMNESMSGGDQGQMIVAQALAERNRPPLEVEPGNTLLDPRTRQPIYSAPAAPMKPMDPLGQLRADRKAGHVSEDDFNARRMMLTTRAPDDAAKPPSGYRPSKGGNLEAIPGGPADPGGPAARKQMAPLRKEFRSLDSVKNYETVLPIISSARNTPDTTAGDLDMVYAVGKILDPGSVVREGELHLTQNATPFTQKLIGKAMGETGQGGRLTPQTRAGLIDMLNQRVGALEQSYMRDYEQYSQYAGELGFDPAQIVGTKAGDAFKKPEGGPKRISSDAEYDALPSGTEFVDPDGKRRRKP